MSARSAHRPRHSRSRDGLARAVLLDESGLLPRVARVVSRVVALLLTLCVGVLLISLIAGNPVRGISNPLHWHGKQAGPATRPRLEVSTPAGLTSAIRSSATTAQASRSSRSAGPSAHPRATAAGEAGARGSHTPGAGTSVNRPAPTSSAASSRSTSTTPPGIGRTHANTTHPRPTKTHHP